MSVRAEIQGLRFGRLVVLEPAQHNPGAHLLWLCRCDCGNITSAQATSLLSGKTKSCGCLRKETTRTTGMNGTLRVKHGYTVRGKRKPEYAAWLAIIDRCQNPNNQSFRLYGGRGITVCERWKSFVNFYADMGNRPSAEHSIDRYPDPDGNYEPGNCRWATRVEQA